MQSKHTLGGFRWSNVESVSILELHLGMKKTCNKWNNRCIFSNFKSPCAGLLDKDCINKMYSVKLEMIKLNAYVKLADDSNGFTLEILFDTHVA